MMFLPDGHIGKGGAKLERQWQLVEQDDGTARLHILGDAGLLCVLERSDDHVWRGKWNLFEQMSIELFPALAAGGTYLRPSFLRFLCEDAIHTIVELGSGVGCEAIALHRYWQAPVYTFECHPSHLNYCREAFIPFPGIHLIEKAVWDLNGPLTFYESEGNSFASSLFPSNGDYPYEAYPQTPSTVDGIRLDTWMDSERIDRIDLLCLDVQGATYQALESLGRHLPRVKYIIAEIETRPIYRGETLFPQVEDLLRRAGFRLWLASNQWGCLPDGQWLSDVPVDPRHRSLPSWFGDFLFVHFDPDEEATYAALCHQRFFRYTRVGHDERLLEFLPDGQIGAGRGACETHWLVERESSGTMVLKLFGQSLQTVRLEPGSRGTWNGRWLVFEGMEVLLSPGASTDGPAGGAEGDHRHASALDGTGR